jgi:hypothetical protein
LSLVVRARFTALARSLAGSRSHAFDSDLDRDLNALAGSGTKLTFIFSNLDPGHDLLMATSGGVVNRLRRQGQLKLWRIKQTNHTFDTRRPRNELIDTVRRHLVASYAGH